MGYCVWNKTADELWHEPLRDTGLKAESPISAGSIPAWIERKNNFTPRLISVSQRQLAWTLIGIC